MSYKNFIPHITASFEELNVAEASTTFNGHKIKSAFINIKSLMAFGLYVISNK